MKKTLLHHFLFVFIFISSSNLIAQTQGVLTCSFVPVTKSPGYQGTRNVLAVWIENDLGDFIKTKFRYVGGTTNDHLPTWAVSSGGPATNALSTLCNKTDATTGATLPTFTAKTFTWDGKGVNGAVNGTVVPDGVYMVTIEETWNHGSGGSTFNTYSFTKGPCIDTITPQDNLYFTGVHLSWVPKVVDTCFTTVPCQKSSSITYTCSIPVNTAGLTNYSFRNPKINVYPNPSSGLIYLDYTKAKSISVISPMGQLIYEEKLSDYNHGKKVIDLSSNTSGIYLIRLSNEYGVSYQKVLLTQ
jgi:hypothetical protein